MSEEEQQAAAPPEQVQEIVAFAMDCARQGETELLARYVAGGFPVDHPDPAGNTVLMMAAYHGHADTVAALVRLGADVDRLNSRSQSPLAGALFKGEDEVVAVLRAAGADPDHGSPSARQTAEMFGTTGLLAADTSGA
jgi:ankyrin repeat protein